MTVHKNQNYFGETKHLAFRPDIEGLRAVAILVVVACHAGVPWLNGGFIGVDVFFVLSGYLITGLLVKELSATSRIDFLDFYFRRLKRLLPGLLTMVVFSSLFSAVMLAPYEQVNQALSSSSVYFWVSNLFFSLMELDYFSPQAESFLFLHTWSLSVEEQFYLVWPIFILGLFSIARKNIDRGAEKVLVAYLGLVFVCSLLLCLYLSYTQPLWGFFMMPSRGWQFAMGGLLFVVGNRSGKGRQDKTASLARMQWAGWAGLLIILGSAMLFSEDMVYPSFWAIFPSLGGALVILSGIHQPSSLQQMLANKPMQFIGKVSYSWYLWHWPVLLLGNILFPLAGVAGKVLMVLVSFGLAVLTLFSIELPLRNRPLFARRPALTVSFSIGLMIAGYFGASVWEQKAKVWANSGDQLRYQLVRKDLPTIYSMGCDDWINSAEVKICSFNADNPAKRALFIGDSIVMQWFPGLAKPLLADGWQVLVLTKSGCPMVDEPIYYDRIGQEYTVCSIWRRTALDQMMSLQPKVIFTGSASDYAYSPGQWLEGSRRVVDILSDAANQVFVIPGTYRLPFDGPLCLARQEWQPDMLSGINHCAWSPAEDQDKHVLLALSEVANAHSNVNVLDLNPLICPKGVCASMIDEEIVYRDFQHVAASFVEQNSGQLSALIKEASEGTDTVR